ASTANRASGGQSGGSAVHARDAVHTAPQDRWDANHGGSVHNRYSLSAGLGRTTIAGAWFHSCCAHGRRVRREKTAGGRGGAVRENCQKPFVDQLSLPFRRGILSGAECCA